MTEFELYLELSRAFSTGEKSVSSILEPLSTLAEKCNHSDIAEWANNELYGYSKGDESPNIDNYRNLNIYAVGQYCGEHVIPGVNPLLSPTEVKRISTQCGIDTSKKYPVEEGFMVMEERVRFSSGRVVLVNVGHVKATSGSAERDIAGVMIVCDVAECLKCLVAVRKQAKDYFEVICNEKPEITKDPGEKKERKRLWFSVGIAGLFTLLGAVLGAVIPWIRPSSNTYQCFCCSSKDVGDKLEDNHSSPMDTSQTSQCEGESNVCAKPIQGINDSNQTNMPKDVTNSQPRTDSIK